MDHMRHSALFSAEGWSISLIGCGGIGAMTALVLAKMGISYMTLFDPDEVDTVNLATQLFEKKAVGELKTWALSKMLMGMSDVQTEQYSGLVEEETPSETLQAPIVISAVDSINARKVIWKALRPVHFRWYLDASMGAEVFMLRVVDATNAGWYQEYIDNIEEDDIPDLPCTAKATFYTAAIAAGHIGATVRHLVTDKKVPKIIEHNIKDYAMVAIGGDGGHS